jgi:hypothetical protein
MHYLPTSTSSSSPSLTVKIVTFDVNIIMNLRQYWLKLKKMQHVNVNRSNRFKRKSISNKAFKLLIKKMYKMFPDTVC